MNALDSVHSNISAMLMRSQLSACLDPPIVFHDPKDLKVYKKSAIDRGFAEVKVRTFSYVKDPYRISKGLIENSKKMVSKGQVLVLHKGPTLEDAPLIVNGHGDIIGNLGWVSEVEGFLVPMVKQEQP